MAPIAPGSVTAPKCAAGRKPPKSSCGNPQQRRRTRHAKSPRTPHVAASSPAPTQCSLPNRSTARRRSSPSGPSGGNRAYYQPSTDTIHIPTLDRFDLAARHAGTLAHEHVHWTGRADRLNRDLTGRFGSDSYAAEELVAELGAAMWCAQIGLSAVTRPDHAAYLAGWLRVLRTDARALVTVASRAQGAVDFLNTCAGHTSHADADEEAA
jgi:hypothetical protein